MELNITIDRALQVNPEFRSLYDGDARMHELIDMAKRLEGLPNHTSVHAAGVVIYPGEAGNYVPLGRAVTEHRRQSTIWYSLRNLVF